MKHREIRPREWLTDSKLTEAGNVAREEYKSYCKYLAALGMPSFKVARTKYFLQRANYWTLPGGYALPPHTVNVCVNNICNLRCRYCDFGQKHDETFYHQYNVVDRTRKIELPLETCKSVVDQVKWFNPIIRASFREPLLYKNILPFIEYTKKNNLPFWLLTNGFNLARFAEDLVGLEVDSVRLSLDGPKDIHDTIRGVKNAYSRMMEGVKILIDKRRNTDSCMQIGFYFTLNDQNYDRILETVEVLDNEGVLKDVFFNFQWLLYTTKKMAKEHNETHGKVCEGYIQESTVHAVDIYKMDLKVMSEQAKIVQRKYPAEKGYRIHFRPSFEYEDLVRYRETEEFSVEDPRCRVLWYNMNINPAGEVKSFHHCLLPVVGDINEQSIMDIWNGDNFRRQRRLLLEHGAYQGCARCWGVYCLLEDQKRRD
ncbi:MAG: radical SAM protein [Desulfobacterales bacterium]|nr:radical SAM protein [Desulfobacterales bacterium]